MLWPKNAGNIGLSNNPITVAKMYGNLINVQARMVLFGKHGAESLPECVGRATRMPHIWWAGRQ